MTPTCGRAATIPDDDQSPPFTATGARLFKGCCWLGAGVAPANLDPPGTPSTPPPIGHGIVGLDAYPGHTRRIHHAGSPTLAAIGRLTDRIADLLT